ncbi:MAG: YfiR family protein [Sphingomonas sp.]|nr:YfiR family protein [Sphingomonas sp.]
MAHVKRLAILLFLFCGIFIGPAAAGLPTEDAVKASYLYKFAPFVDWPSSAFATATAPLFICIAGADPFGEALDEAVRGEKVNGHPIAVRRLGSEQPDGHCHILFAGKGESAEEMLHAVVHQPVLTVTDRSEGVGGGMIQFVTVEGRVRFMVDEAAAQGSGIVISSKLLGLAVSVTR